jgi:cytochrome c553
MDYKLDNRKNYLMQLISKGYSEQQIRILSYYFSKGYNNNE